MRILNYMGCKTLGTAASPIGFIVYEQRFVVTGKSRPVVTFPLKMKFIEIY
jgi:hypothetical protein